MNIKYFGHNNEVGKEVVSRLGIKYHVVLKGLNLVDVFRLPKKMETSPIFKVLAYEYDGDWVSGFPDKVKIITKEFFDVCDNDYINIIDHVINEYEIENYKDSFIKLLKWDGEF